MPGLTPQALEQMLAPLTRDPDSAAILCDIDGVLAPIVSRAEEARVADGVTPLLAAIARRYRAVAVVTGRSVAEARRLVGVGAVAFVGSHGAEIQHADARRPVVDDAFAAWEEEIAVFCRDRAEQGDLRRLRLRLEDKGPIKAFHWRGATDPEAAVALLTAVAEQARAAGLGTHWGRKVLEIRPPLAFSKGDGVRAVIERSGARTALYGGDDVTDLDAFDALGDLGLEATVCVGVASDEGPRAIVERADLVVDGVPGFTRVLEALARH